MRFDLGESPLQPEGLPDPAKFEKFHPFIKGVFSQWHFTPFTLDGQNFVTGEQAMMFAKAELFGDLEVASQIMATGDPAAQKRLGRLVRGFDEAIWDHWKLEVVRRINRAKFGQNSGAARQLMATGGTMLVEANFSDWIWGVGLSMEDPRVHEPASWSGTNYLGRILTMVRSELEQRRAGS